MNNLSLIPDKIQFKSIDCKFFEHRLTPEGLKPDPEKIKAILAMQPLQSIQQLQSFNGMVNYLKRFSPVLSELAEPLRKLQKSDTVWAWESEQQTAFEKTKTVLTTLPILASFDKNKDHIIQTCLKNRTRCSVATRGTTCSLCLQSADTLNNERELLGVVFGLERLHHYTFGKPITVETDHQPLTSIWKKTIATSSPRLQRLLLRLAQYDVHIEYLRGKENVIADALSRVTSPTNAQSNGQAECFVQTIKNSLSKAIEGGEDPHLAILAYATTPLNHSLPSPAELLNSRKYRCILPVQVKQQNLTHKYRNIMQRQKQQQTNYYNRNARDLPSLKTGRPVYVQLVPKTRNWIPGHIIERLSRRTYKVKTYNGGVYIRNRKFIKPRV